MNTNLDTLIDTLYDQKKSCWESARRDAETFISQLIKSFDPYDHYSYSINSRIKTPESARNKIERKINDKKVENPTNINSLEKASSDWVGVKISCNTTDDANSLIKILSDSCKKYPSFAKKPDGTDDIEDYINKPKPNGYRAYHAVLLFKTFHDAQQINVKVEIQIKTRLQDAWGELTHETLYKPGGKKPEIFHERHAKRMADLLHVVDDMASDLTNELIFKDELDVKDHDKDNFTVVVTKEENNQKHIEVEVHVTDKKYALAKNNDGKEGLIRAIWVRDLLVEKEKVGKNTRIDVDDYIKVGDQLPVITIEENEKLFFKPISLGE